MNVEAVGSYRRQRDLCGDVDVLITTLPTGKISDKKQVERIQGILPDLTAYLEQ